MSALKYIGPTRLPFTTLHAYGRDITPELWDKDEQDKWFSIDPRYKKLFAESKDTATPKELKEPKGEK